MKTRTKFIIAGVLLISAFAAGRFSAPEKIKTETKIVEVEKKVTDSKSDVDQSKHAVTTIIEVSNPDGSKTKTTTITTGVETHKTADSTTTDNKNTHETQVKEVVYSSSRVTISVLTGVDVTNLTHAPIYGGSVIKPILGPVTIGAFGMSNGVVGASAGLIF